MSRKEKPDAAMRELFEKKVVAELGDLKKALCTESTMTVFRHLKPLGYLTSFTHRGRFYVLKQTPVFDEHGLWFHGEVGFSDDGTLRKTLVRLIERSQAGLTPETLRSLTTVRVYDALVWLVRNGKVNRTELNGRYLYLSIHAKQRTKQIQLAQVNASARQRRRTEGVDLRRLQILTGALQSVQEHLDIPRIAQELGISRTCVEDTLKEEGIVPGRKAVSITLNPLRD
jgi:hypothetical protein